MPRSSRDTMTDLMRTVYKYKMREQFVKRAMLLQLLRRNTETYVQGKQIDMPLHVAGGSGFAFSSAGRVPAAGSPIVDRALFTWKMMTDRIEFTGDLQQDTSSGEAAERQILDMLTQDVVQNAKRGMCYHLYRDGTGKVGAPLTATDSVTLTVDALDGISDNMRIDILLTADGSTGGGVVGAQVRTELLTNTITLQNSKVLTDFAAVNANPELYTVYRHGSRNDAFYGFEALISNANPPSGVAHIGGIDRSLAGNDFWRSKVFASDSPREPALPLIAAMFDEIHKDCDSETVLAICHPSVLNWIKFRLLEQKTYFHDKNTLHGWIKAVTFGDMERPIVADHLCPRTKMFFLDPRYMSLTQPSEGEWMDDGSIIRVVPDTVAYEATWFRRGQLIPHKPRAFGVIENLVTSIPG